MNKNARSILVSAITDHGEKLATSDAYCKVYLAGYMVDYPAERQLFTLLKQRGLPKTLIAYLRMEVRETDLHAFIKMLKQELTVDENDLAWGIDAWAAALSVPSFARRNIREQFFLSVASNEVGLYQKSISKPKAQRNKGHTFFPFATLLAFVFTSSQLTGYIPAEDQPPTTPEKLQFVSSNTLAANAKPSITLPSPVIANQTLETELIKRAEPVAKAPRPSFNQIETPTKSQRAQRLDAEINAFLQYRN